MSAPTSEAPGALRLLAARVGGVAGSLAVGQLLTGLTYVLATRAITPATLGIIATCFAIATISATVFDLGLTNYLVREVAARRFGVPDARALVATKRRLGPVLTLPVLVACVLIARDPVVGVVLGLVAPLCWEAGTANALLRAQERFSLAATGQLLGRALGLGVTGALLLTGEVELALPVGLVTGFAGEVVADRFFLGGSGARPASLRALRVAQRASVSFGLVAVAAMGQFLDTPLVAAGGGAADAGIYAGAGRLINPLLFLSTALALVGLPWLARAGRDLERLRHEELRIAKVAGAIALAPLVAAAAGPFVVPLVLGAQYADSGWVFAVLAIGAVFSTVNQGLALVLQNRGHERVVGRAITIGLVQGLVVTYLLAMVGGPVWAAVGYTVSQLYMVAHLALRVGGTRNDLPPENALGDAAAQ